MNDKLVEKFKDFAVKYPSLMATILTATQMGVSFETVANALPKESQRQIAIEALIGLPELMELLEELKSQGDEPVLSPEENKKVDDLLKLLDDKS